jgi:hypothetical protein
MRGKKRKSLQHGGRKERKWGNGKGGWIWCKK